MWIAPEGRADGGQQSPYACHTTLVAACARRCTPNGDPSAPGRAIAGGRRDGPRRKAKLRAKKDLTAKVPRKQCALKAQLARLVGGGYVVEKRQVRKFLKY